MKIIQRFKRLSLWNKLGVLGAIASIIGLPLGIRSCLSSGAKTGLSEEEIQSAINRAFQENAAPLRMKYGEKYTVAAITPDRFVVPKGNVPSGIKVKWETGRVINMSSERVEIVAPEIIWNTDNNKDLYIAGNIFNLPKKVGAKVSFIHAKDFSAVIEVIGVDRDIVTIGLGIAPN